MSQNRLNISKNIPIFVSRPSFGLTKGCQGGFNRWPFLSPLTVGIIIISFSYTVTHKNAQAFKQFSGCK